MLAWVSAKAHESLGDTLDAERLQNEALAVEPRRSVPLRTRAGRGCGRTTTMPCTLDGTIALADVALAVEAMGGSRIEELLGVLAGVLPDAEVLEQSRTPLSLDALRARAAGVQPELEQDPEMVEFMAQHMREYEQCWLHMELRPWTGTRRARPQRTPPGVRTCSSCWPALMPCPRSPVG